MRTVLSVFAVDGSGAGSGNLEILVNGGHVTSFVRNLGNQRFLASFVPHEPVVHKIDMKFNDEPVIGKFSLFVFHLRTLYCVMRRYLLSQLS